MAIYGGSIGIIGLISENALVQKIRLITPLPLILNSELLSLLGG